MRLLLLACLALLALPAAASADRFYGRYSGSFSFDRDVDEAKTSGDASYHLVRNDHWTVTLGDRILSAANGVDSSYAEYRATITGSVHVDYSEQFFNNPPQTATGHWEGSGPVRVSINEIKTDENGVKVSELSILSDHFTGTEGLPGQWTDNTMGGQTYTDPFIPLLDADIAPGEATARTTASSSNNSWSSFRVTENDWPETGVLANTQNLTYTPPGDTADLAVSVDAPDKAVKPGAQPRYVITVTNSGPGSADAASVAISSDNQAMLLGDGAAQCTGLGQLSCQLGSIEAGGTRTFEVVAVARYPRSKAPGSLGSVGPVPLPLASAASVRRDRADITATVSSVSTDPDQANNSASGGVRVTANTVSAPKLKGVPVANAAANGVSWGWFGTGDGKNGGIYRYGLIERRNFKAGGKHGVGAFRVNPRFYLEQRGKNLAGNWREIYVMAEYRLSELRNSQFGGTPTWSSRLIGKASGNNQSANLAEGAGEPYSGDIGVNPSWRVRSERYRWRWGNFPLGVTTISLKNPNSAYKLEGRFRHYVNQFGRDEVFDSGWQFIDSVVSGPGY
jgi:uncharacterized protein DUF11